MEKIYEIEGLKCSYDHKRVVLDIDSLDIYKGEVTFFVGPSGVGKSTILETLGLMNKTILPPTKKFLYNGLDMCRVWNYRDADISAFRSANFSFIFQQTNLMPNFSAFENVMTSALLQGRTLAEAKERTAVIIRKMKLPEDDRTIQQYSGGQRQRLAFARAMLAEFSVLFGDEPTGNLDAQSAENLMKVLIDYLHETQGTAIIVSHDLNLSIRYAHRIVLIKHEGEGDSLHGKIDASSVFVHQADGWHNENRILSDDKLKDLLYEHLQ